MDHVLKNHTDFFIKTYMYKNKDEEGTEWYSDIRKHYESSLIYQKTLLDKGYIQGLMKLKKLQPTISKQIKDIKKTN